MYFEQYKFQCIVSDVATLYTIGFTIDVSQAAIKIGRIEPLIKNIGREINC